MEKQDLTEYSDSELSNIIFNDEYFYEHRHKRGFIEELGEFFIFTPEQAIELAEDLEEDLEEIEAFEAEEERKLNEEEAGQ